MSPSLHNRVKLALDMPLEVRDSLPLKTPFPHPSRPAHLPPTHHLR